MDFIGLGRLTAYKLSRPLSDEEKVGRLQRDLQASSVPRDWLSVIKIDSTCLELVDRWYPVRGFAAWFGAGVLTFCVTAVVVLLALGIEQGKLSVWIIAAIFSTVFGLLGWSGLYGLRLDCFRQTHYPIRLNRRTRQVHAYRPDGSIVTAGWDDLFLCAVKNELTMWQTSHDVRAHILADDGETVVDTFTLAHADIGHPRKDLLQLWEYIRRYMEEPDGVEQCFHLVSLCLPLSGRREGLKFGIVRLFATAVNHLVLQIIISPMEALNVWGRWFAMATCKVPVWPAQINAACSADPDDPYRKDWRSNGKYDFYELVWPSVCLAVGTIVIVAGIFWLFSAMWE